MVNVHDSNTPKHLDPKWNLYKFWIVDASKSKIVPPPRHAIPKLPDPFRRHFRPADARYAVKQNEEVYVQYAEKRTGRLELVLYASYGVGGKLHFRTISRRLF